FIATHDQFQEIFGGRVRQLSHAEIIDDEERHGGQIGEIRLPRAIERRVSELLQQRVRLAIDDAIALQDRGTADGLREVTLARPRRSEEEHVLALGDEARRGELVDERAIHLLVEIKVKGVERALGVAKAREFVAALEQAVLPPAEFVLYEGGREVDGCLLLGLRL